VIILTFEAKGTNPQEPWVFQSARFGRTNLIVGKSGTGKSRLLNTIFNLASSVSQGNLKPSPAKFLLTFDQAKCRYRYEIETGPHGVVAERLELVGDTDSEVIIDRTRDRFLYLGQKVPQLDFSKAGVSLLQEEEKIRPVHEGFGMIWRRRFDADGLEKARGLSNIPKDLEKACQRGIAYTRIFDLTLSSRIYLIQKYDKPLYSRIKSAFQDVFPEFTELQVRKLKPDEMPFQTEDMVPGLFLTEKGLAQQVALPQLSSGMQKVLLIITDILSAPHGVVYMIDEYENSLGVNAIDFLPELLSDVNTVQTLVTTHHPHLINAMPVRNWQILSREGPVVTITPGAEREDLYNSSAQEAFLQLLNDPIYDASPH